MKQVFVRQVLTTPRGAARHHQLTDGNSNDMPDPVVVREYFPFRFRAAVKQKSRWVLGITLQGWRNLGWAGNPWMKYMLFRDRKSLVTSIVNVLGYVALAAVLGVARAVPLCRVRVYGQGSCVGQDRSRLPVGGGARLCDEPGNDHGAHRRVIRMTPS
jgi:adsorption protein B